MLPRGPREAQGEQEAALPGVRAVRRGHFSEACANPQAREGLPQPRAKACQGRIEG